jgi:hypothetical protein
MTPPMAGRVNRTQKKQVSKGAYTRQADHYIEDPFVKLHNDEKTPPITRTVKKMKATEDPSSSASVMANRYTQQFGGSEGKGETVTAVVTSPAPVPMSITSPSSPAQTLWKYLNSM